MPRGDGTGPMGEGPMTGRAMGFCAGYPIPGYMNFPRGGYRAYGGGFGYRRGNRWRHWFYATGLPGWYRWRNYPVNPNLEYNISPEAEAQALKTAAQQLKAELSEIEKRIKELEKVESQKD
ncbi:hypothetical protein DRQ33_05185 [bacterium]|nr:MAG: hypothetical protein DRQ33_05185 [bacterium]